MKKLRTPGAGSPVQSIRPSSNEGEQASDRYVVKEELAAGGMGAVYRVIDRVTGEARALKRLHADAAKERYAIEAFEREYQVLAGLAHPRIIRVFDYGVDETGPYYTMELLEGQDMRKVSPLPFREACLYLRDVATSLALLHARGLIHRDLSPTNVRKTSDGHCKLIDFGALAHFGASPMIVGTPPCIPPEALDGAPLDQRADLYAFGALAYWMLTRRHAYPARSIEELPEVWKHPPPAPSERVEEIPKELDGLVLALLSRDPLARPGSAAEVISRLGAIAGLPPEEDEDAERLAQSFFLTPRFTGRDELLHELDSRTDAAVEGHGSAVLISAVAGMGRTRLLEEVAVRAQIAGAHVLRVDASMFRQQHGTARALAMRLVEAFPELARRTAKGYPSVLALLDRVGDADDEPAERRTENNGRSSVPPLGETGKPMEGWFAEISQTEPLAIEVDNVEEADPTSLGMLAALARLSPSHRILMVVTERVRRDERTSVGLHALRSHCTRVELLGLDAAETLELTRSLFGDAPNVARFAEWLYGESAGSPLHCIEVCRHLVAERVIRYRNGMWVLPASRPDSRLNVALEDALSVRLGRLSHEARRLAECLSLQQQQATLELCRLLSDDEEDRHVLMLLDELAREGVLFPDQGGYRFSSAALREALLGGMDAVGRERNHRRLGEAFATLAGDDDPVLQLEAGWHLIRGGDESRGADMIAAITHDSVTIRHMSANLHLVGKPLEAALQVYKRQRRSVYERMPVLAALAHAGYYEDRAWEEKYGDETMDVLEYVSGLRIASRLMRLIGRPLALGIGLAFAWVRFHFVPKRERKYRFRETLVQLFGVITALTGVASLSLDVKRATRVARVLEPFSFMPRWATPSGIYSMCRLLPEIGREHQATASPALEAVIRRFRNPRYFPTLPDDARVLCLSGAVFAEGAYGTFREDGRAALESANSLDATGIKMYQMIASQLRFLHYLNRGELGKALEHRQQVEIHAAHVGSAWQVETWEPAALVPVLVELQDVVGLTRVEDRLAVLSERIPSMKLYHHLAQAALIGVRGDFTDEKIMDFAMSAYEEVHSREPRSFIGWATTLGVTARFLNRIGDHAKAKEMCEEALAQITDADREYVTLFQSVDVQMAFAEAALGDLDGALERIERLLDLFRESDHPLLQGTLHEARARIAWDAGLTEDYETSLAQVERWFRPTGTPALIAKCEQLAKLARTPTDEHRRMSSAPPSTSTAKSRRGRTTTQDDDDAVTATARTGPRRGG